jgi:hypothetical protein
MHPSRPALADEIKSYDWLYFDPKRRSVDPEIWAYVGGEEFWQGEERAGEGREDEVKAFNEAHRRLGESVRQEHGRFRLRGAPNHPSKPLGDIDPADVSGSKLHVFAGTLRGFDGNKHIKTYYRVHCYETDVNRCVAELRSGTQQNRVSLAKPMSKKLRNFTTNYKGQRTLNSFTAAAQAEGINATREILNAALDTLGPRRRGRPLKSQAK